MVDRFLVVVPTHRPALSLNATNALRDSLTYPTEFHVLDGSNGKVTAINRALVELLDVDRHDIYVTVDDDIRLPYNWQHFIACAFDRIRGIGICGIDLQGTPSGDEVMGLALKMPRKQVADIVFRETTSVQNVAGACLATRSHLAKKIGPYPFTTDGRRHCTDEDAWRCHRCRSLRYRYGYVTNPHGNVELLQYDDDPEYIEQKQRDMDNWRDNPSWDRRKAAT